MMFNPERYKDLKRLAGAVATHADLLRRLAAPVIEKAMREKPETRWPIRDVLWDRLNALCNGCDWSTGEPPPEEETAAITVLLAWLCLCPEADATRFGLGKMPWERPIDIPPLAEPMPKNETVCHLMRSALEHPDPPPLGAAIAMAEIPSPLGTTVAMAKIPEPFGTMIAMAGFPRPPDTMVEVSQVPHPLGSVGGHMDGRRWGWAWIARGGWDDTLSGVGLGRDRERIVHDIPGWEAALADSSSGLDKKEMAAVQTRHEETFCQLIALSLGVLDRLPAPKPEPERPEQTQANTQPPDLDGWLSEAGLAERFNVPSARRRTLRKWLKAYRENHPDRFDTCWRENTVRSANSAKYDYCVRKVYPEVVAPLIDGKRVSPIDR